VKSHVLVSMGSKGPAPRRFECVAVLTNESRGNDPNPDRLQRLSKRGFIKKREDDKLKVTMKGRAALIFGRR
jgi:hypothetical protein